MQGFSWYQKYTRRQVAEGFGDTYNRGRWDSGIVRLEDASIIFVTFEKTGRDPFNSEIVIYHYGDRFLAPDLLLWQSQLSMETEGKKAQRVLDFSAAATPVYLFVRRIEKNAGRTLPFVYCGRMRPVYSYGERPITAIWRLENPLPPGLMEALCPGSGPCRQVDIMAPESAPVNPRRARTSITGPR